LAEQEDEPKSLEEEVQELLDQQVKPEAIAEKILQEDLNASVKDLSRLLGLDSMAIGRIKGRLSRLKKRKQQDSSATTLKPLEEAEGPGGPYKEEIDATSILRKILLSYPNMPTNVVEEVCSWAAFGPIHPTQLVYLLQSMKGISNMTANVLAQKYSLALQKAALEGKANIPPLGPGPGVSQTGGAQWGILPGLPGVPPPGGGYSPGGYPQAGQGQGQGQYNQPPLDMRTMIREEVERQKPRETADAMVEIEEPVRAPDGSVIVDDHERPIVRRIRAPASQAASLFGAREDPEARILDKMAKYKELFGEKGLDESKIRAIIRDELPHGQPSTEKPVTLEDVKTAASNAAAEATKAANEAHEKEKKEDERFRRLEDSITRANSSRTVEGYRDDGFRVLGQGMSEASNMLRDRKPVEVFVRDGLPYLFGGVPGKQVEPGAAGGLIERLEKRGWVAES